MVREFSWQVMVLVLVGSSIMHLENMLYISVFID